MYDPIIMQTQHKVNNPKASGSVPLARKATPYTVFGALVFDAGPLEPASPATSRLPLEEPPAASFEAAIEEAAYLLALLLVRLVDDDLTFGWPRYYATDGGRRLYTLNEVVRAILNDTALMPGEEY